MSNVNNHQIGGTAIDTNSGNKSAGTQRVVVATDQPNLTTPLNVDTELPAAAALSDTQGNPTTPIVGSALLAWDGFNSQMHRVGVATGFGDAVTGGNVLVVAPWGYNGTTFDRLRTGTQSNVAASTGLQACLLVGQYNATQPTVTDTRFNNLQLDVKGRLRVSEQNYIEGVALTASASHITTATTTTPVAATAYIASIAISVVTGGAGSTLTIRDKGGTPKVLVNAFATATATTTPTVITFNSPMVMTSGIDIITTATAPTVDVWINYLS
jgi:hypothetical protein